MKNLIDHILDESSIKELIAKYVEYERLTFEIKCKFKLEKKGEVLSKFDEEMVKLSVTHKLVKALGNYTLPTDSVLKLSTSSRVGNIEITAIIVRNEVEHIFSTTVIYAGGYNIQCFHIRYIVSTTLPKISVNPFADEIKKRINAKNKEQKLRNELASLEKRIGLSLENKAKLMLVTEESVWKASQESTWGWNPNSSIKSQGDFDVFIANIRTHNWARHLRSIDHCTEYEKVLMDSINKIKIKLENI